MKTLNTTQSLMIKSKLKMSYFLKGLRNSFPTQKANFKKVPGRTERNTMLGFVCKTASTQRTKALEDIDYFEKNIYTKIWQSCSKCK